jgi:hypothetical protein
MDPAGFRQNIKHLVFAFSDQVPFWVLVKGAKQLYGWWGSRKKDDKGDANSVEALLKSAGSWSQIMKAGEAEDVFDIQVEEEPGEQEQEVDGQEFGVAAAAQDGMTQKRGLEAEGSDRYRITVELEQYLLSFCNLELEPQAHHAKALLILVGVHGREGRFIKDEESEYAGKPVFREAGTSARGLLRSWVGRNLTGENNA